MAIFTAGLTAYYTFRVWFRVCAGPASFEPGDEQHDDHGGAFHPHAPRFAINMVLVLLAVGSLVSGCAILHVESGRRPTGRRLGC